MFVDAGYLLASAADRVTGTVLRGGIHVDYEALIRQIIEYAEQSTNLELLRLFWYDASKDGTPDTQQQRIGSCTQVKLRLGRIGPNNEQKGVDLRIGLDLVSHARRSVADVFLLISGDDDLTEAVEEAQSYGIKLVILAAPDAGGQANGVSRHLRLAADDVVVIPQEIIDANVVKIETLREPPPAGPEIAPQPLTEKPHRPSPSDLAAQGHRPSNQSPPTVAYSSSTSGGTVVSPEYADPEVYDERIRQVVAKLLDRLLQISDQTVWTQLKLSRPSLPVEYDGPLLTDLARNLEVYSVPETLRIRLRREFWRAYDERLKDLDVIDG